MPDALNLPLEALLPGVELDDLRLLSQEGAPRETNDDAQSKFHNRMNILSQLVVSNESKNVRKVVITHMTDLIKANRGLFHNLVVNEQPSRNSSTRVLSGVGCTLLFICNAYIFSSGGLSFHI